MSQPLIDYIRGKSVLLLGFGREGRSTYEFIRSALPEQPLTIADQNEIRLDDGHATLVCGKDYLRGINAFELVLKSPGISARDIQIDPGVEMSCQTDLFLRFAPCTVVGVTGTKGKTTTATLIDQILRAAGRRSCLIGNIGVPVLDRICDVEGMTAVVELSSHQLEFTTASPHIAVLTNLYPEHLDHYNGFAGYAAAKSHIFTYQTEEDVLIYNPDQDLTGLIDLPHARAQKIPIGMTGKITPFELGLFHCNPHLKGKHNHQDIRFACAAARALGVPEEAMAEGIRSFAGIPHRMELVGAYHGITFYNDAIATIPHAVLCAVEALGDVDTLILGGMDRGLDYAQFVEALSASSIRNLIGLPDTGHAICRALIAAGARQTVYPAEDMEQAVAYAYHVTQPGMTCLFSPAASSYNVYKNFEEKGGHFKQLVRAYGGQTETDGSL